MTHETFMNEAINWGEKARLISPPNPWVGCIIVKDQIVIGSGHTLIPGQSHAEICALREAGSKAQGSTLYTTLEPCSHHGRTPPCAEAIIKAKVKEVIIAIEDPDEKVQGNGIRMLKEAGINVKIGICKQEAEASLRAYLYQRKTGLPFTIIKAAISMDGRIAAEDGSSQWITTEEAREDAHHLRAHCQAIIIGTKTALYDKPKLTARSKTVNLKKQPLRVVLDPNGRVPLDRPLFDLSLAETLVFTTKKAPINKKREWESKQIEFIEIEENEQGIHLEKAWTTLAQRGILQLLVEGGSKLQSEVIKASLSNSLVLYMGSLFLGHTGAPLFHERIGSLDQAIKWKLENIKIFENCVRLNYFR